jgi:uncharacterized protein (TIGR00297 family)
VAQSQLAWQSKLVLLLVVPWTGVRVLILAGGWFSQQASVAAWCLGLSAGLGLLAWRLRAASPAAALTGAVLCASLMFTMFEAPFRPWRTGLVPVVMLIVLTSLGTRFGRRHKARLGTAEQHRGRGAAQVAANLGMAALIMDPSVQSLLVDSRPLAGRTFSAVFALGLAALAESAGDTLSSEIGQVVGGTPRMITTMRRVAPGSDGGITPAGTLAGMAAAALIVMAGFFSLRIDASELLASWAGGVFGLLFDSLLGATLERAGWLNNDAVNFLSTGSAAGFALALMAVLPHPALV